jgi:hypothetical protein
VVSEELGRGKEGSGAEMEARERKGDQLEISSEKNPTALCSCDIKRK